MVDTTTTVLAFIKQTIGGNRNTWGSINNSNFDLIEEAICGRHAVSTTGGSTTLTQEQARNRYIDVTGTLVSDATIVVPNASKEWVIINSTSGDFGLLVKTSGGDATTVPAGTTRTIFCDGDDNCVRDDLEEVGKISHFSLASGVPPGYFECTGATKSRAGIGLDLYRKAGTTWGVGNGVTTFTLPDTYTAGKFLRGRTSTVAVGTSQTDQNKAHTHTGSVTVSGSATTGTESAAHSHTFSGNTGGQSNDHTHNTGAEVLGHGGSLGPLNGTSGTTGAFQIMSTGGVSADHSHLFSGTTATESAAHTHGVSVTSTGSFTTDSSGGTEARPTNLTTLICIKY